MTVIDLETLIIKQRQIDNRFFPGLKKTTHHGYWSIAIGEEIGEFQGALKKYHRNLSRDGSPDEMIAKIAEEAADVMIYLLITSDVFGIDPETLDVSKIDSEDMFELSAHLGKLSGNIQYAIFSKYNCIIKTMMEMIISYLIQFGVIFNFDLFEATQIKQEANIKRSYDKN